MWTPTGNGIQMAEQRSIWDASMFVIWESYCASFYALAYAQFRAICMVENVETLTPASYYDLSINVVVCTMSHNVCHVLFCVRHKPRVITRAHAHRECFHNEESVYEFNPRSSIFTIALSLRNISALNRCSNMDGWMPYITVSPHRNVCTFFLN